MKAKAADFLIYDEASGLYRESPEQAVRDDVEKHYWLHVGRSILKDWRLYLMLIPMLLVFLFWRYFPMYELLGCFKVSDEVLPVSKQLFSGFSYFKRLLVGGDTLSVEFWRAMRNTFILSFYGLCFGFPMPIILALFFNEIKSNIARSVYQVLTYLPKFMSYDFTGCDACQAGLFDFRYGCRVSGLGKAWLGFAGYGKRRPAQ